MNNLNIELLKKEIISTGRLLWDKGLVSGWNGNLSLKVDTERILLTARGTCLGYLKEDDIVLLGMDGSFCGDREPSTEKALHQDIYKNFPEVRAVIHTHTVYTNAYFLDHELFSPATLEAENVLGQVFSVDQDAVNVLDTAPVLARLRANKLVVLKRHGVVSVGQDLFGCFARIQVLEEQVKMEALRGLFACGKSRC
jgi:L-fuculose-phosphate aldolase